MTIVSFEKNNVTFVISNKYFCEKPFKKCDCSHTLFWDDCQTLYWNSEKVATIVTIVLISKEMDRKMDRIFHHVQDKFSKSFESE